MIEAVLGKLSAEGIAGTCLQEEWQRIRTSESDSAERQFCEFAARLGEDPYTIDPKVGSEIEHSLSDLHPSVHKDFFDSADPAKLKEEAKPLIEFLHRASKVQQSTNPWNHVPVPSFDIVKATPPWEQGYEYARFLRKELGLNGQRFSNEAEILSSLGIDLTRVPIDVWPTEQLDAVTGVSAQGTPIFALSGTRSEARNFAFCRAFGEFLQEREPQPIILTRRSVSQRQKRSRAFAAEFLAPAEQIRKYLKSSVATDRDCEDLGAVFGVSSWVIQHQIVNHRLAEYAGPSF